MMDSQRVAWLRVKADCAGVAGVEEDGVDEDGWEEFPDLFFFLLVTLTVGRNDAGG